MCRLFVTTLLAGMVLASAGEHSETLTVQNARQVLESNWAKLRTLEQLDRTCSFRIDYEGSIPWHSIGQVACKKGMYRIDVTERDGKADSESIVRNDVCEFRVGKKNTSPPTGWALDAFTRFQDQGNNKKTNVFTPFTFQCAFPLSFLDFQFPEQYLKFRGFEFTRAQKRPNGTVEVEGKWISDKDAKDDDRFSIVQFVIDPHLHYCVTKLRWSRKGELIVDFDRDIFAQDGRTFCRKLTRTNYSDGGKFLNRWTTTFSDHKAECDLGDSAFTLASFGLPDPVDPRAKNSQSVASHHTGWPMLIGLVAGGFAVAALVLWRLARSVAT